MRDEDSVVGGGSDQLRWMKKAIVAFDLAAVAGIIPGVITDHPVLTEFPNHAIVVSFSAFFISTALNHFHLKDMSRVSDCVGVFSGTLALGWVLSIAIKGRFKWFAFLPCAFPTFLLAFELYQLVVLVGVQLLQSQPASNALVEKARQTFCVGTSLAMFRAEDNASSGDQLSSMVIIEENQQEYVQMWELIGSPS